MQKSEWIKRYILLTVGLFFSATGVALTKHAELGVSPISSVASVMSDRFTDLTLGTWLMIWNGILILGQILILRKKFKWIQLLQIPLSFVFGWFTDVNMWLVSGLPVYHYGLSLVHMVIGILVLSFGITLTVIANVIMNSGEAFVKAVSETVKRPFGHVKIVFDVSCVILALAVSLLLFDFTIVGTREGTVLTALLTGVVVNFFHKRLHAPLQALLTR